MLPSRALVPAALLLLGGCHAKFKKHAPELDAVRVQVITAGQPRVELGRVPMGNDSALVEVASAAINIAQGIKSIDQTARIARAVDVAAVNDELALGIAETLGGGPPFSTTDAEGAPVLQIEVLDYGLYVPYLGAPGMFTWSVRARIYTPDGERVYRTGLTCQVEAGSPSAPERVLGVVNNVAELNEMTDGEIHDAFALMARYCGERFAVRMRKHAG